MAQLVNLPDGSQASFPDGTPPEVMKAAIQKKFPPAQAQPNISGSPDDRSSMPPQLPEPNQARYNIAIDKVRKDYGLSDQQTAELQKQYDPSLFNLSRSGTTFGLSDELSGLAGGLSGLFQGKDFGQGYGDFSDLQNKTLDLAREKNGMLGSAVELGTSLATMAPEKAAMDAVISGTKLAPSLLKTAATSGGTGAVLGGIGGFTNTDGDVGHRLQVAETGALAGGALGTAAPVIARGLGALFSREAAKTAAPTVAELKSQAGSLYDAARNSGVTMNQSGTIALSDQMHQIARDNGLVSPTGRVASSYPKINEVLKTFDDFSAGQMDVPQMQAVKRTLQDAAGSPDPGERRVGTAMLKEFDNFVDKGVPQLKDANAIYRRAKKGELIDTAIELAGSRAGQFSGSGFENALRTEFRSLDRQIIKGDLTGITDEEAAAIKKVANGGPIENLARYLGKFAPTGVVPAMASGGAFAAGNAVGGPVAGGLAAAGTAGLGIAGRLIGTGLQKKNAAIASALMRRGNTPAVLGPDQQRIAQALINSGALGGVSAGQTGLRQGGW